MTRLILALLACALVGCAAKQETVRAKETKATTLPAAGATPKPPRLGNFSISLTVKDLTASRAFYEKLGFKAVSGNPAQHWLVMQNDTSVIGLFQGMFEKNMLTYNPGWDRERKTMPDFDDVRDLQKLFKSRGIQPTLEADAATTGPASVILVDPDGNPILIDQFVDRPKK